MTHRLEDTCVKCLLKNHRGGLPESATPEQTEEFRKRAEAVILKGAADKTAPEIVDDINRLRAEMFGVFRDYAQEKRHFNELMLAMETDIRGRIEAAQDPLKAAIQFATIGNLIDFGAFPEVSEELLCKLLAGAEDVGVAPEALYGFQSDIKAAGSILYITDNCGEIVADKLLIEQIRKEAPDTAITVMVRGFPVANDATKEDAEFVGLDRVAKVIGNGSGIAGTAVQTLSAEALEALRSADMIISKGQGNFETLQYEELPVWYIFLVKCSLFSDRFNVPVLTGMLLKA